MSSSEQEKMVLAYTRLPAEVADRLEKAATAADRTVAAEMRRAVRLYLEDREASGSAAA